MTIATSTDGPIEHPYDSERAALPPGNAVAWAILIAGTSLDGLPWPGWGDPDEAVRGYRAERVVGKEQPR